MTDLKCVYTFNEDEQFLTINFLQEGGEADNGRYYWSAFVFDENWSDLINTAASISDMTAESVEYAYETLGIRGRLAVLAGLRSAESITFMIETSLFHLQALLFASTIIVVDEVDFLDNFGFAKETLQSGKSFYFLASEAAGDESCRFL
ncbi:hypothetical protein AABM38_14060 [Heyndrickxia sp. MSNUG]|uniref:hypothetical protein n=1 Tax=Heyndrickxia sp. MSNUG TaxID=3136677 RepID=UPI003C2F6D4E